MFSPTLIWMRKPNRAFMFRSFSLFINWLCSSYSMKGSRLEMAVAFTSPWAFLFKRQSLKESPSIALTLDIVTGFAQEICCSYLSAVKQIIIKVLRIFHVAIGSVVLELYLAWIKHPFPVTAASVGRSIVVNSTSGTLNGKKYMTLLPLWIKVPLKNKTGQRTVITFCRLQW